METYIAMTKSAGSDRQNAKGAQRLPEFQRDCLTLTKIVPAGCCGNWIHGISKVHFAQDTFFYWRIYKGGSNRIVIYEN